MKSFGKVICLKCFSFLCRCKFCKMKFVGFLILFVINLFGLSCKGKTLYSHFFHTDSRVGLYLDNQHRLAPSLSVSSHCIVPIYS